MTTRGRKPKPAALRLVEGKPGHRVIPEEVEYPPGWPPRPEWLSREAVEHWDFLMSQMERAGVVSLIDAGLLAGLCDCYARAVKSAIRAQNDTGQEARAGKAWDDYRKYCAVFGIGPAERSRVKGSHGSEGSASDEFFRPAAKHG
jgi:phage terminase small subunit